MSSDTPLTELDAVNMMLSSIGQSPINSLLTSGIKDAAVARLSLSNTTREVLSSGWSFNTDYELAITKDLTTNLFLIPSTALSIVPVNTAKSYVERWNSTASARALYDNVNHTFALDETSVTVTVIYGMNFEEMPQAARHFVATRAARIFQSQVIGSDILFKYTAQHEMEALALLKKAESKFKRRSIFNSASSTNNIVNRNFVPSRGFP